MTFPAWEMGARVKVPSHKMPCETVHIDGKYAILQDVDGPFVVVCGDQSKFKLADAANPNCPTLLGAMTIISDAKAK